MAFGVLNCDFEAFDGVKSTFEVPSFGGTISYSKLDDYLDTVNNFGGGNTKNVGF